MEKLQFARNRKVENCPCGESNKSRKFVPYQGYDDCGYCHGCSKTFLPERNKEKDFTHFDRPPVEITTNYVERSVVNATLKHYEQNNFANWLTSLFGEEISKTLLHHFVIGTAKGGYTIFWHLNEKQQVTSAKKMLYGVNGKRNRTTNPEFLFKASDGYRHCLFGLHQLRQYSSDTTINLVESEKSAVIGYAHMPQYCWLATGGTNGLTKAKAEALKGRKVIIIPDCDQPGRAGATNSLQTLLDLGCKVIIKDLLPELNDGTDIADIYTTLQPVYDNGNLLNEHDYPAFWDN